MNTEPSEEITYWYLSSPCNAYVHDLEESVRGACQAVNLLEEEGIPVYSPVVHGYATATVDRSFTDPLDLSIWVFADRPMMDSAHGLIVLMLEGWENSASIKHEIAEFEKVGKPIMHMAPGDVLQVGFVVKAT